MCKHFIKDVLAQETKKGAGGRSGKEKTSSRVTLSGQVLESLISV